MMVAGFSLKRWLRARGDFACRRFAALTDALKVAQKTGGFWLPVAADRSNCRLSPIVAVIINLVFPGAAQLFTDQIIKGVLYLATYYSITTISAALSMAPLPPVFAVLVCVETWYTVKGIRAGRRILRLGFFR
jgi:hypothetical protein